MERTDEMKAAAIAFATTKMLRAIAKEFKLDYKEMSKVATEAYRKALKRAVAFTTDEHIEELLADDE